MERTPGYEPGSVRSSRAGKVFEYRRMAKPVSHPALNRKNESEYFLAAVKHESAVWDLYDRKIRTFVLFCVDAGETLL